MPVIYLVELMKIIRRIMEHLGLTSVGLQNKGYTPSITTYIQKHLLKPLEQQLKRLNDLNNGGLKPIQGLKNGKTSLSCAFTLRGLQVTFLDIESNSMVE